jgi:hypothetical protein
MVYDGRRWLRLAGLHPEMINHVELFRDGRSVGNPYDEPFILNTVNGSNWYQRPFGGEIKSGVVWRSEVHPSDGKTAVKEKTVY